MVRHRGKDSRDFEIIVQCYFALYLLSVFCCSGCYTCCHGYLFSFNGNEIFPQVVAMSPVSFVYFGGNLMQ